MAAGSLLRVPDELDENSSVAATVFADIDGDDSVDSFDLGVFLSHWGQAARWVDLDQSGIVGAGDLTLMRMVR